MSEASVDLDLTAKNRRDSIILFLACAAQFMVVLDVSVVNVALPSMGKALHFSPTGLQWVVNAYVLAFAGFLLLGGRAADLFGRKRIFLIGVALFSLASLSGGLATTSSMLTVSRTIQGLGGALLSPATLTIVVTTFRGPKLAKALGAWGAAGAVGGSAGSLLGGILTAVLSWRWVLFINVPVGIAVMAGALIYLPEVRHPRDGAKLDIAGAVLVTSGLTTLVYAIVGTNTHPWGSSTTITLLIAAAVLLGLFALVEGRIASAPLMPFSFLKNRITASVNLVMLLNGAAFFSMWYFLTLYYQEVQGWSALRTGFAFAPQAVMILLGSQIAARLMHKHGSWPLMMTGLTASTIGFFIICHLTPTSSYFGYVLWPAMLISLGLGLFFSPSAGAATGHVGHEQAGLASGLLNTSRQMGGSLGLAVLATIAASATSSLLPPGVHQSFGHASSFAIKSAIAHGYNKAFLVAGFISLAAALAMQLIPRDVARAARPTVESVAS